MLCTRHLLSLFMVACIHMVSAQETSSLLQGRIADENGNAISDVFVKLTGEQLQGERQTVSDPEGFFRFVNLPNGSYQLVLEHISFATLQLTGLRLKLGQSLTIPQIHLTASTDELPEVLVTAVSNTTASTSIAIEDNIVLDDIDDIPLERDYSKVIELLPGVNASFLGDEQVNISGATGLENAIFIDGMNTTNLFNGSGGTQLPYNFVEEINVKSGGFEAEFGRATGGIINLVTRSGGNTLSADAFGYFSDNSLSSDGRRVPGDFGNGIFQRYDAGFSVGGPVIKNKLWYFAAYNHRVESEDASIPGIEDLTDKRVSHIFAGKLSWQPAPETHLQLSIFGDPTNWDRVGHNFVLDDFVGSLANPEPFLGKWQQGSYNFSAKMDHALTPNWLGSISASRQNGNYKADASSESARNEPTFIDLLTGEWSGGYGGRFDRGLTQNAANFSITYFKGLDQLKAGVQFEDNILDEDWRWESAGPDNAGFIRRVAENSYQTWPLVLQTQARNRVLSAYLQAEWYANEKLILKPGIRWDGQYLRNNTSLREERILNQYQPRFGLVWLPQGKSGDIKLSASAGRFYEQIPTQVIAVSLSNNQQIGVFYPQDPRVSDEGRFAFPVSAPDGSRWMEDLNGEHYDELTLQYQQTFNNQYTFGIQSIFRRLREIVQNVDDPFTGVAQGFFGNPGRNELSYFPDPQRDYSALTISFAKNNTGLSRLNYNFSYTLSRTYGNYPGLFNADDGLALPNFGTSYDNIEQLQNSRGLLPNDRTHVFKLNGSLKLLNTLTLGTYFTAQSGTPLNELGAFPGRLINYVFLTPRGQAGRLPAIYDLNLRFTYTPTSGVLGGVKPKLTLDVLHLFSQREVVNRVQLRYLSADDATGEQLNENPNYLNPTRFQPPTIIRLGLELGR